MVLMDDRIDAPNYSVRRIRYLPTFSLIGLLSIVPASVFAMKWDFSPSVTVSSTYTDNLFLSNSSAEDRALVTDISPAVSVARQGARMQANMNYRAQRLIYTDENTEVEDVTRHQFKGSGSIELIKDHFFVDGLGTVGQQTISNTINNRIDNITPGNSTNVYTAKISPIYRNDFGGNFNLELRYDREAVRVGRGASDSDLDRIDVQLLSGRKYTKLKWGVNYSHQEQDRESASDTEFESINANIDYSLNPVVSFLARGGREDNTLETDRERPDGSYWEAGFGYTPSEKLYFNALYGDNAKSAEFGWKPTHGAGINLSWRNRDVGLNPGDVYSADISFSSRRARIVLSYEEDTTTSQSLQQQNPIFQYVDPVTLEPVLNPQPGESVILVPIDVFGLTDDVFVRKRAQASWGLNTAKSALRIAAFNEKREFEVGLDQETINGASVSFNWKLGARANLLANLAGHETDFRSSLRKDRFYNYSLGINRRMASTIYAAFTMQFVENDSSENVNDYQENRYVISVEKRF